MISFKNQQQLNERLLIINKGKRSGQIVFLAGGAGSGKGFVIKNFMEGNKFKVIDVDAWKEAFLKLSKIKDDYKELSNLNLKNPGDVFKLHMFIKNIGIKDKTLDLLMRDSKSKVELPNIIFDITLKELTDITNTLPMLLNAGYDPKNIHVVWVLTDYAVAVKQNRSRDRIVPDDILLKTHEGAVDTMHHIISGGVPAGLDGSIHVVLGGAKNTVLFTNPDGTPIKTGKNKDQIVVKDFKYVTVKEPGKRIDPKSAIMAKVYDWIENNGPLSRRVSHVFTQLRKAGE